MTPCTSLINIKSIDTNDKNSFQMWVKKMSARYTWYCVRWHTINVQHNGTIPAAQPSLFGLHGSRREASLQDQTCRSVKV